MRGGRAGMGEPREQAGVSSLRLGDEWLDLAVGVDVEPAATVWMHPVETVSLSEAGLERLYQGTCLLFRWPLELAAGGRLALRFEARHARAADEVVAAERATGPGAA